MMGDIGPGLATFANANVGIVGVIISNITTIFH
ncbi:hypothetical protein SB6411_05438 [Klebsiella spallanzanii]|uniref:Uncharacterized protein n=1 Tax=Klebsiella spallanzanii TaxID=2587528 RepID=A0ABY6VAU7_9ENTR|nr:hypothetical protein SB6411_05438 [Klebsiella spallanzanii]